MSTRSIGPTGRRLLVAAVAPWAVLVACGGSSERSAADRGAATTADGSSGLTVAGADARPVGSSAATTAEGLSPMRPSDITDLVRSLMVATPSVTATMSDLVSIPYEAGLPFAGFANAHSPHSGDGVVYLDHPDYSEWSRTSVNENTVSVTVEDAR